jgi:hypothetical protein
MYELDGAVGEKEVAFAMRTDERVIPVDTTDNEDSNIKLTVRAEVYWKGNRHTTRRLLQIEGSGIDTTRNPNAAFASSVKDVRFAVKGKGVENEVCVVNPEYRTTHVDIWTALEGRAPNAVTVRDLADELQVGLAGLLDLQRFDTIQIESIEKCEDKFVCSSVLYRANTGSRRLQQSDVNFVHVRFSIGSETKTAGMLANDYQALAKDGLQVANSKVYKSVVEECNKDYEVEEAQAITSKDIELDMESGAFAPAALSALALIAALFW